MHKKSSWFFEPQDEGGCHVYAPNLPDLPTQGDDVDDAMANASEAVGLYVGPCAKTANRSTTA